MLLQDRARQHWARTGGLGVGGSCVPDWEKGWETLPLAGLLSAVDPVHYEGYFPVSVSWAGSSNPGRKYILQGPALPLILLWPQFQGLGLPGSRVSSEGRLLSIYRWRGVQKKNIIWLPCSPLVIVSLVLSPTMQSQPPGPQHPCRPPCGPLDHLICLCSSLARRNPMVSLLMSPNTRLPKFSAQCSPWMTHQV